VVTCVCVIVRIVLPYLLDSWSLFEAMQSQGPLAGAREMRRRREGGPRQCAQEKTFQAIQTLIEWASLHTHVDLPRAWDIT